MGRWGRAVSTPMSKEWEQERRVPSHRVWVALAKLSDVSLSSSQLPRWARRVCFLVFVEPRFSERSVRSMMRS